MANNGQLGISQSLVLLACGFSIATGTQDCFAVAIHHKNAVILNGDVAILKILSTFFFCAFKYT